MRAYPVSGDEETAGGGPVWIEAGHAELIACGFGGQWVRIPASEIGAVKVSASRGGGRGRRRDFLSVLDKEGRETLRARAAWDDRARTDHPAIMAVCRQLDLAYPEYLTAEVARGQAASWRRAPGYRRLRTRPEGIVTSRAAWACLALAAGALCVAAGVWVAVLLPGTVGTVDVLIGIALVVASLVMTIWFLILARRARNWLRESLDRGAIAPLLPSFARDGDSREMFSVLTTVMMMAAIPLACVFGPVFGLISLVHGFDDQAIVSVLRQHGAQAPGKIKAVVTESEDSDGGTDYTTTIWLYFSIPGYTVSTTDPGINGWTWPASQPDVTVIYLPSHPVTAAVAGQLDGSPWRGAVTGNLITGAVLTAALVPLTWATIWRLRANGY